MINEERCPVLGTALGHSLVLEHSSDCLFGRIRRYLADLVGIGSNLNLRNRLSHIKLRPEPMGTFVAKSF